MASNSREVTEPAQSCYHELRELLQSQPMSMDSLPLLDSYRSIGTATEHSPVDSTAAANDWSFQNKRPILEVAFRQDLWWSIPQEMSQRIFDQFAAGRNAIYTWDWGDTRSGSWQPNGADTSINRYEIDFDRMVQRNLDNNRMRSVRFVWVRNEDVSARWSGQTTNEQ